MLKFGSNLYGIITKEKYMAFETRDEVREKVLKMEKPICPNCKKEMTLWEVPQITFGDGLGWGSPYMFVCFNDECPAYKKGWDNIQDTMEYTASYRCITEPGSGKFDYMPVFSPAGGKGQMLDDQELAMREAYKEAMKEGFSMLTDFYVAKEWDKIMAMLLDPSRPPKVRLKGVEMVEEIGGVEAIEPLLNHDFPSPVLQKAAQKAVATLHERHFTRECPYCAEIIKKKAKICKHCGREL